MTISKDEAVLEEGGILIHRDCCSYGKGKFEPREHGEQEKRKQILG